MRKLKVREAPQPQVGIGTRFHRLSFRASSWTHAASNTTCALWTVVIYTQNSTFGLFCWSPFYHRGMVLFICRSHRQQAVESQWVSCCLESEQDEDQNLLGGLQPWDTGDVGEGSNVAHRGGPSSRTWTLRCSHLKLILGFLEHALCVCVCVFFSCFCTSLIFSFSAEGEKALSPQLLSRSFQVLIFQLQLISFIIHYF